MECIANFQIDPAFLTQALHERGLQDVDVVATDISKYFSQMLKPSQSSRFVRWFGKLGIELRPPVQIDPDVRKIVFFNLSPTMIHRLDFGRLPKDKIVLFMWEPRTVIRKMYQPELHAYFSKVYTWDDSLVDGLQYFKFNYPVWQPFFAPVFPSFQEKKLCTMMASNLHSKDPNSIYHERTRTIEYFEACGEDGFEFYGRHWPDGCYRSYRGTVPIPEKLSTIKHYRFMICYENTQGVPGYITEKIFECFAAGVVPVYWGASNVADAIPKNCFIDRRDFATFEALHRCMREMPEAEYARYLQNIAAYLESEPAQRFSARAFGDAFFEAVGGEGTED